MNSPSSGSAAPSEHLGGTSTNDSTTGSTSGDSSTGGATPTPPVATEAALPTYPLSMELTPTFESMGIRLAMTSSAVSTSTAIVEYRVLNAGTWRRAQNLWGDFNRRIFVGSVVNLTSNTVYEFRVTVSDPISGDRRASASQTTWNETFPVGSVQTIGNRTSSLTVNTSGLANAFVLIAPPSGQRATINVSGSSSILQAMQIDANYVIVRNIDFVGGVKNSIFIANNRHDIVIENCTFTQFGAPGKANGPGTFPDERDNAAILVGNSWDGSGNERIVIQHNSIFNPSGGSNSWDQGHPTGPHGIYFLQTNGNHVVRYNRISSIANHYFNDCIGGGSNFSTTFGSVNKDSDIYGNIISQCWDDGIEVEGRDENVRVWGNYIHHSAVGIASAAVTVGPLYVFRNIITESYFSESDSSQVGIAFKTGWPDGPTGRQYTYNNTVTGPHAPGSGIGAAGGALVNHISRNNIFDVGGSPVYDSTLSSSNSFNRDLLHVGANLTGVGSPNYSSAVFGVPVFSTTGSYGDSVKYFLVTTSSGYRQGIALPNFTDAADESELSNPDLGAFDDRFKPLVFGP